MCPSRTFEFEPSSNFLRSAVQQINNVKQKRLKALLVTIYFLPSQSQMCVFFLSTFCELPTILLTLITLFCLLKFQQQKNSKIHLKIHIFKPTAACSITAVCCLGFYAAPPAGKWVHTLGISPKSPKKGGGKEDALPRFHHERMASHVSWFFFPPCSGK